MSLNEVSVGERCFLRGGKAWFPVAAEFNAARISPKNWRRVLLNLRAWGVNAIFSAFDDPVFLEIVEKCGFSAVLHFSGEDCFFDDTSGEKAFIFAPLKATLPAFGKVAYGEGVAARITVKVGRGCNGILYPDIEPFERLLFDKNYRETRRVNMFLSDFGDALCDTTPFFTKDNPTDPADYSHLRYSVRHNGKWGYVCLCNYLSENVKARPHFTHKSIKVPKIRDKTLSPIEIEYGACGFYPFDLPISGGIVRFMEIFLLCRIGETVVLYGDCFDATGDYVVISVEESLRAQKITVRLDIPVEFLPHNAQTGEYLVISEGVFLPNEDNCGFSFFPDSADEQLIKLKVYPKFATLPIGFEYKGREGAFWLYERKAADNVELIFG